jgi:PIN domain nuclease of toxin-antitoxin system
MTLLLDTHTVLWFWWNDPHLSAAATAIICDPDNRKLVRASGQNPERGA